MVKNPSYLFGSVYSSISTSKAKEKKEHKFLILLTYKPIKAIWTDNVEMGIRAGGSVSIS